MDKYICISCGYIYDPEKGDPVGNITPGTAFIDLPDDWVCPMCYAEIEEFDRLGPQRASTFGGQP